MSLTKCMIYGIGKFKSFVRHVLLHLLILMTYDLQQAGRGVDMSWGKSSIFPVM